MTVLPAVSRPWRSATPFVAIGAGCVVAGGLTAAALAHAPSRGAMWAVAYVVLVGGVAQLALGVGQALVVPHDPPARIVVAQALTWNLGNAAVLAGTLAARALVTDLGSALLISGLVLFAARTRSAAPGRLRAGFRLLLVLLAVSVAIGSTLAHVHPL